MANSHSINMASIHMSILEDEDFAEAIHLCLQEIAKDCYICAQDIVDFIATLVMQEKLKASGLKKRSILVQTVQHWLHRMGWWYGRKKNGMYVDGHEHEDIVEYWERFIKWWKDYERQMVTYDNYGNIDNILAGFLVPSGQPSSLLSPTNSCRIPRNESQNLECSNFNKFHCVIPNSFLIHSHSIPNTPYQYQE